jgi:hypothetical protein
MVDVAMGTMAAGPVCAINHLVVERANVRREIVLIAAQFWRIGSPFSSPIPDDSGRARLKSLSKLPLLPG